MEPPTTEMHGGLMKDESENGELGIKFLSLSRRSSESLISASLCTSAPKTLSPVPMGILCNTSGVSGVLQLSSILSAQGEYRPPQGRAQSARLASTLVASRSHGHTQLSRVSNSNSKPLNSINSNQLQSLSNSK